MYRFDGFTLDPQLRVLSAGGVPLELPPKAVELLVALVENAGAVSGKSELMDRLWPDGFVEEANLTQYVYLLRKTFAARGVANAIQTVPRRGYSFMLPLGDCGRRPLARRRYAPVSITALVLAVIAVAVFGLEQSTARPALQPNDTALYALGRYYWSLRTVPALHRSVSYFDRVIHDAPHSALGYAGLADAYLGLYDYACAGPACSPYRDAALRNAERAVAVDDRSSAAHTSFAMALRVFRNDYRASDAHFRRALALDPRNALAHEWYGNSLLIRGRVDAAAAELRYAALLNPISPATFGWLARAEYFSHKYRAAVTYAREALAIDPTRNETRSVLALAYEMLGDRVDERSVSKRLQPNSSNPDVERALAMIASRNYTAALAMLKRAHIGGDTERAFIALDPRLDSVRGDPRFAFWTTLRAS